MGVKLYFSAPCQARLASFFSFLDVSALRRKLKYASVKKGYALRLRSLKLCKVSLYHLSKGYKLSELRSCLPGQGSIYYFHIQSSGTGW